MAAASLGMAVDGGWREARADDRTPELVGRKIKVFWDDESGTCKPQGWTVGVGDA